MAISLKTHKMLWAKSGNRCAFPECKRELVEDETEIDDASIVGDEAHMVAKEVNGPRGISDLSQEDRDKYENLILLCKIHHKLIDDQPNTYSVEILKKIKEEHIEWVKRNLHLDDNKRRDDETYAAYVDKWLELANIDEWKNWTSYLLGSGQPSMSVEIFKKLQDLNSYLFGRIWPKRYENLEFAFKNFRLILNDFLQVFSKYKILIDDEEDPIYETEEFHDRLQEWNPEKYDKLSEKFDYHVDLVQDLICELTRAANFICDQVRKFLSSSFRLHSGVLLIETGVNMNFQWTTVRLEYKTNNLDEVMYKGLREFMKTRQDRGYNFGIGISEDYFPKEF